MREWRSSGEPRHNTPGRWQSYGDYELHEIILIVFKPQKKFSARNISAIVPLVYNLISKIFSNENLVDNGEDDADLEEFDKSFVIMNRYLLSCSLDLRRSHSLSSKLQEKAWPKKTSLIHTDTLSRRYAVFLNKDSTPKLFAQEMLYSKNF